MSTPTYEDLLTPRGGTVTDLSRRILAMQPGEVLDAGDAESSTCPAANRLRATLFNSSSYVRRQSPHTYATRYRDGHLYVLCLRPEDVNGAKPVTGARGGSDGR